MRRKHTDPLDDNIIAAERKRLFQEYQQSVEEWESGKLKAYKSADEFIRSLEDE